MAEKEIKKSECSFDLTNQVGYKRSLQELRRYITQGGESESSPTEIIEIATSVKGAGTNPAEVKLFMIRSSRYVIGFRGAQQVIALRDANPRENQQRLAKALKIKPDEVFLLSFGVTHENLGTYYSQLDQATWAACHALSEFKKAVPQDPLRPLLSLLVCMIAEGSRFTSIGGQCTELIGGRPFRPAESILKNYGRAVELDVHLTAIGLTLKELEHVRASVVDARKRIMRALHLKEKQPTVEEILNYLYGRPGTSDLKRLRDSTSIQSDVNFEDAIKSLLQNAPKLIGFVPKHSGQVALTAEQVDKIGEIVNKLSDSDVKATTANLA